MIVNDARATWRDFKAPLVLRRHARRFGDVMVEPHSAVFDVRQIDHYVLRIGRHFSVLSVLGMDHADFADLLHFGEQNGADQTIKIATGDDAHSKLLLKKSGGSLAQFYKVQ